MKYSDLQRRLKQYQSAGLTTVRLNSALPVLEAEYQRCLKLGLCQSDLDRLTSVKNYEHLELISCLEMQAYPQRFPLSVIKAKTYHLGQVANLEELKLAFPIFKDRQYDFRTKVAWLQCASSIDRLTSNSQDFAKFKQDLEGFVTAIEQQKYHQLTGEMAVAEAYDDLCSYISWWKGAQWEYTLATQVSTLDLLKRAWLEQFFARHDLSRLLEYSPID